MTLPDDYLQYPKRRRGLDIDRYDVAPPPTPATLAGGKRLAVAIVIPIEWFPLNPSGAPFKHPGAMATPYPDLRHFTTRDYGTRVGAFRLLRLLKEYGLTATFAVNAAIIERAPPLIEAICTDGHEIAAHGLDTDHIHWGGLDQEAERELVDETRRRFSAAGLAPRAWMSPARQQSFVTPDLIRAAGFDVCLDWEANRAPHRMRTMAGALTCFPLLNELDDRLILITKAHSETAWRDQIVESALMMIEEAEARNAAGAFGFTLTPYIAGQPFRIRTLAEILGRLAAEPAVMTAGVSALADAFGVAAP